MCIMYLLLTCFFLILSPVRSWAINVSDYRFHTMPETSYYSGIHSITKDSIGRMWFSGSDALFVYNGDSFVQMNDSVTSFFPTSHWSYGQVVTDASKQLYVATNHGLLRFNYRKNNFELLLEGVIGSITAGDDGTVWLVRNGKIESFHPDSSSAPTSYAIAKDIIISELIYTHECIYIASAGKLYKLNKQTGEYALFATVGDNAPFIKDVLEYEDRVYILTHKDGLFVSDGNGQVVEHYNLFPPEYDEATWAKKMYMDSSHIIWIGTQAGLFLLDPSTGELNLLRFDLHNTYSLPNNSVWSIYPDPDGGVWIGTYGGKLAYMTFDDNHVNYFRATPGGLNHPIVSCFEEDKDGNLWIGTEGGGLNRWNRRDNTFTYYTQGGEHEITSNMVKKLKYGRGKNALYISAFNGGIEQFDERKQRFVDLQMHIPGTSRQLGVYDFEMEADSGIWMTNPDSPLMYKDLRTGTIESVSICDTGGKPVRMKIETLYRDKGNGLWLITHQGVYIVDVTSRRIVKRYYIEDAPFSVNNLCSFCVTTGSGIWFGTRNGGVNRLGIDGSYTNLGAEEGLAGITVFAILEDEASKDVWFSTNDGLYYYDFGNQKINKAAIGNFNSCGAFYLRSCYRTSKGEMLFGGTNGFIMFTPKKIRYNKQKPKVFFTDFFINHEKVVPGAKDSPLKSDISTLSYEKGSDNKIVLSHKQVNLQIHVSANSYLQAQQNRYAYRMLGLSEQWNLLPQGQRVIQFFDLPAGKYLLEVKACNNDGLWGEETSALYFEVMPSPFLSVWAYIVYSMLALIVVYFIWRYFTNKKIFQHKLELEQIKEQKMQELTQARINFFTNISHDLKTPLCLVLDPLKKLKESLPKEASSHVDMYVQLIERNINRIQRMISQLLQFREIESQKITLNLQPGDLIQYIRDIFSLFELYANKKGIEMDMQSDMDSFYTRFDHDVIEKIMTNLFSNAIKYTPEKGFLGVKINKVSSGKIAEQGEKGCDSMEYVSIAITNTGTEIPNDKKEEIFEAFKRLSSGKPAFEESTGLGLAIVKELVGCINGKLTLQSGDSKVTFTIVLPFTSNVREIDGNSVSYDYTLSEIDNILTESEESIDRDHTHSRKASSIVLIEDDAALRTYMEQRLSERYNVYTANNGADGITKVKKIYPQVVITDLMMPVANGFDVCHTLHSALQTSHIPIIVLSALGQDTENKIKALESGANVFIDKPFDMDYLLKQVDNLIKNQNKLKELYSKKYIAEPSKITISSMDEDLLKKAMDCIEKNISNSNYNVEAFVSDMGVGRTLLYQKINDIVGMSIKEFIMDIRLKRGAQLLKESDLTISEIADRIGFDNPKYFSICFKKHFELTPSEFKKKESIIGNASHSV